MTAEPPSPGIQRHVQTPAQPASTAALSVVGRPLKAWCEAPGSTALPGTMLIVGAATASWKTASNEKKHTLCRRTADADMWSPFPESAHTSLPDVCAFYLSAEI